MRMLDYPTHAPLGQYVQPTAHAKSVSGLLKAGSFAFWNIEKK